MATAEEKSAPSKGKMKGLVILIVVGIIAAGGGYATPLVLKKFTEKHTENVKESLGSDGLKLAFIPFDTVVVNINEANLGRFLRIKAILKNWLIGHLSDKSMQDVAGAAGVHRSRREILDQFNTLLFPDGSDKIRDILFEEFNVQ